MSPGGRPLAGFADRLLAWLVDAAILGAILFVVVLPVYVAVFVKVFTDLDADAEPTLADFVLPWLVMYAGLLVFTVALGYLYEVEVALRGQGRTIGKRVARVRVVPLDPTTALGRRALTRRWLVSHLATLLVPGFSLVDGLWQLGDQPYQQCLHDKAARTVVVKDPS
jgi:uncharacterized RDD family membrane protein YckC